MKKTVMSVVSCTLMYAFSLLVASPLWSINSIDEDFRFLDRTYRYTETTPAGRKVEEFKHFHSIEGSGMVVERTVTSVDGEPTGRERAWWFTDERQDNHFRVALLPNGNLWVMAMGRVSSGYKGAGMNESEIGTSFVTELNYNAGDGGRLRISSGPLVARGFVNDSMFFRKTWRLTRIDREGFTEKFLAAGGENVELSDALKPFEPLLGIWEGTDERGNKHRNIFFKQSPNWMLEFWRIGEADGDGPRGTNIIGTDTLQGGAVTRSSIGSWGYNRTSDRYVEVEPGTIIQFQGTAYLVREISGDTMTVTWNRLNGTEYEQFRKYELKKATN